MHKLSFLKFTQNCMDMLDICSQKYFFQHEIFIIILRLTLIKQSIDLYYFNSIDLNLHYAHAIVRMCSLLLSFLTGC